MFCSNAISSEVYGSIEFTFYVRHPRVGLYHGYENYVDLSVIIDISDILTNQISLSFNMVILQL